MYFNVNVGLKTLGIKAMENQFIGIFWQIKKDTLAGEFGFVGRKNGFYLRQTNCVLKPFFLLTKAMQLLPIYASS